MSEFSEKEKIGDIIPLRCKHCAAALEVSDEGKEYVTCNSCGTTQKMLDARAFLDQIMGQVHSWVSSAIPQGFDLSNAENVDPIARHNIFVNNIRPKLETEYGEYKFNGLNLFTNMLFVPPFMIDTTILPLNNVKDVFEFNAKIKSVNNFAIDEESKNLVNEADGLSTAYAYVLNNIELIRENKPERFDLMSRNFDEAAKVLDGNEKLSPLHDRIKGLYNVSMCCKNLMQGNLYNAKYHILQAQELFKLSKNKVISNFEFGIMSQAIENEIIIGKAISYIVETAEREPSGNPLDTMSLIENLMNVMSLQETYEQGNWNNYLRDKCRCEEILKWVMEIRNAQLGDQSIKILNGGSSILFPFWVVNLPYSFKTGALWMKKGIEVIETILISAGFTTNEAILGQPSLGVTDVFAARDGGGFFSSITGGETSISKGGPIKKVVDSAIPSSAGGRKIVPPLSTKKEASYLIENYIDQATKTDRVIANKLRLSAPRVEDLIFISGNISGSSFNLDIDIGNLCPQCVGDLSLLSDVMM